MSGYIGLTSWGQLGSLMVLYVILFSRVDIFVERHV